MPPPAGAVETGHAQQASRKEMEVAKSCLELLAAVHATGEVV